jgi:hypothetical protein
MTKINLFKIIKIFIFVDLIRIECFLNKCYLFFNIELSF